MNEAGDRPLTDEEYGEFALDFFESLATKTYTAKKLVEIHKRGDGAEMRKFLSWYKLFVFELQEVPQHWLIFTTKLLNNAAHITETEPDAREGLLAKTMGLQGGTSIELRNHSICAAIQQYRNDGLKVWQGIEKTMDRADKSGFQLGYESIEKIWNNRDKGEVSDLARAFPTVDFIASAANQYKRG